MAVAQGQPVRDAYRSRFRWMAGVGAGLELLHSFIKFKWIGMMVMMRRRWSAFMNERERSTRSVGGMALYSAYEWKRVRV